MTLDISAKQITRRVLEVADMIMIREPSVTDQKDFAREIGANPSVLSGWKRGDRACTVQQLYNVCNRFKVNPGYLILGIGDVFMTPPQMRELGAIDKMRDLEKRVEKLEKVMRFGKGK